MYAYQEERPPGFKERAETISTTSYSLYFWSMIRNRETS